MDRKLEAVAVQPDSRPQGLSARLLTGAEAAAHAMRQINPDVFPVYPITPQTPIIQTFARFTADELTTAEVLNVESEHSAMSAAIGSALAGARTMTATASQGLALMVEVLYIAASMRAPVVMAVGNRALSGPINIHCDHSDSMLARDSGAVQIFAESAQEVYDLTLLSIRIAEDPAVLLPVLVCQDGFTVTHTAEPVEMLSDQVVRDFTGEYRVPYPLLDTSRATTQGPFDMPDYYFEHKRQQAEAIGAVPAVLEKVAAEFFALSGRRYEPLDGYRLEDAERAVVLIGSTAGTAKEVVDQLRSAGEKVGLLRIRLFRPFLFETVRKTLGGVKAVAVLDRALSLGSGGPLFLEMATALYGSDIKLRSYVYGLGGRDLFPQEIRSVFEDLTRFSAHFQTRYIGLRE